MTITRTLTGGKAVITSHSAVFGVNEMPCRSFAVREPQPYAQHDITVTIEFIEPGKRRGKLLHVYPTHHRYFEIETAEDGILYDSRWDVPCDTDRWEATKSRLIGRSGGQSPSWV